MYTDTLCRDPAAAARLVVGAFTVSPSSGVVPPNGQVLMTVECTAEQAGYISEVNHTPALTRAMFLSVCLSTCLSVRCLPVCVN